MQRKRVALNKRDTGADLSMFVDMKGFDEEKMKETLPQD